MWQPLCFVLILLEKFCDSFLTNVYFVVYWIIFEIFRLEPFFVLNSSSFLQWRLTSRSDWLCVNCWRKIRGEGWCHFSLIHVQTKIIQNILHVCSFAMLDLCKFIQNHTYYSYWKGICFHKHVHRKIVSYVYLYFCCWKKCWLLKVNIIKLEQKWKYHDHVNRMFQSCQVKL